MDWGYAHQQESEPPGTMAGNASPSKGRLPLQREGDAFLESMRMRDVLLLTEDGPYSAYTLGMRHPYGQVVLAWCATGNKCP